MLRLRRRSYRPTCSSSAFHEADPVARCAHHSRTPLDAGGAPGAKRGPAVIRPGAGGSDPAPPVGTRRAHNRAGAILQADDVVAAMEEQRREVLLDQLSAIAAGHDEVA